MPNPSVKGDKVEKYRLTDEQLKFQKRFRSLNEVRDLLQLRTLGIRSEVEDVEELWRILQEGYQWLKASQPKESTKQFYDMDFVPKEKGTIQY